MDNIAHRGARLQAVENTLEAIHIAWEEGADAVELDVQITADHELVIFHDGTLAQWTGKPDSISAMRWRDLREVRLTDSRGHVGRIPHLDEVMETFGAARGWFNLELKVDAAVSGAPERLAELVAQRLPPDPLVVVSSFSADALRRFAECLPAVPTAVLIHNDPTWPWSRLAEVGRSAFAADVGAARAALGDAWRGVHPHGLIVDTERLAAWRAIGLAIRPWVVNEPRHWEMCLAAGVDGAITDDPAGLSRYLLGNQ